MSAHDAPEAPAAQRQRPKRVELRLDAADQGPRQSSSVKSIVLLLLLAAVTGGLCYVGLLLIREREHSAALARTGQSMTATLGRERTQSAAAIADLQRIRAEQDQRVSQADVELLDLKATLAAAQTRLDSLEAERAELGAQMAEYREVAQRFRSMIDSGKLSIVLRRGRMIVQLPAAVLFASGSAELSADGGNALKQVAAILREVPGKRFIVAGHTDDVPIASTASGFSSNWALSAARAVTVTEALLAAGMRPSHLVAAGYGEYDPIASNTNAANRQKNRRIEIVLEPELSSLPSAIATKAGAAEPMRNSAAP